MMNVTQWEGPQNILTSLFGLLEGSFIANLQTEAKKGEKQEKFVSTKS